MANLKIKMKQRYKNHFSHSTFIALFYWFFCLNTIFFLINLKKLLFYQYLHYIWFKLKAILSYDFTVTFIKRSKSSTDVRQNKAFVPPDDQLLPSSFYYLLDILELQSLTSSKFFLQLQSIKKSSTLESQAINFNNYLLNIRWKT